MKFLSVMAAAVSLFGAIGASDILRDGFYGQGARLGMQGTALVISCGIVFIAILMAYLSIMFWRSK